MTTRNSVALFVLLIPALSLSGCGGGSTTGGGGDGNGGGGNGGGGGGNGGGGGGGSPPYKISLVTPSQVNSNAAATTFLVHGSNFTSSSTVEIDGTPVANTVVEDSTLLWAFPGHTQIATPATYSVTVNGSAGPSNALPLTVYQPQQGPLPFLALPGYSPGVEGSPTAIATGDLNGDGRDDVVINAGPGGSNFVAMLGQPDGSLGPPQTIGPGADAIAVGDVNGDGFPDIVTAAFPGSSTSSFTLYLNDGTGNFVAGQTLSFTGMYPNPIALADLRGTGRNDLLVAVTNPDVLYLFPNQGNGTFGQPITVATSNKGLSFVVADFNGDGKPDIAYSGVDSSISSSSTHLLINQGSGVFNDVVPAAMANIGGLLVVGDFNNDGRPDLAIQIENQRTPVLLKIFLNTGSNSFAQVSSIALGTLTLYAPYTFAVGDFDHDGYLDIAAENGFGTYASSILFLWGNGTGNFTSQEVVGPSGVEIATGDINGDGIPDILIPDTTLAVTVVLGNTSRTYPQPTLLLPPAANFMAVGDVNGDGFPDLLFVGDDFTPSSIFLNDGHGNFSLAGYPPLASPHFVEELVDLNRNGKTDLVGFSNTSSGGEEIVIYPATGDPNYPSSPIIVPVPLVVGNCVGAPMVDLDGDGLPDIVCTNQIGWNQGNYQFSFAPMNMNGILGIGDVNNDGRADLITPNGTFLNLGNRQFRNIYQNGLPITWGYQVVFGDFNGDGIVDVAFADLLIEQYVGVAFGRGDGTFYVQSNFATSTSTLGNVVKLAAGDFNRDGLSDLVVPLFFGAHVQVLTSSGNGQFKVSYFATGVMVQDILKVDLNMDGKPDLIILPGTPTNFVEIVFSQ